MNHGRAEAAAALRSMRLERGCLLEGRGWYLPGLRLRTLEELEALGIVTLEDVRQADASELQVWGIGPVRASWLKDAADGAWREQMHRHGVVAGPPTEGN